MKGIVISVVLLLVDLSGASAQSLADVAKKEKERREALGSTKAETHDDSTLAARRRAMPPSRRPTSGLPSQLSRVSQVKKMRRAWQSRE